MNYNLSTTRHKLGDTNTSTSAGGGADNSPANLPLMPLQKFLDVKAADEELEPYKHQYDIDRTKQVILEDIQANIIKPTKHKYTLHCLLTFNQPSKDEELNKIYKRDIVSWLKNLPLTSAADQATMEEDASKNDAPAISLLLSFEGYNFFYRKEQAKQFIAMDDEPLIAFREGLAKRCPRAFGAENDNVNLDGNFNKPIHAMVLIASNDDRIMALNKEPNKAKKQDGLYDVFKVLTCGASEKEQGDCPDSGSVFFEIGMRNPEGSDGPAREWFGFIDGISNPRFFSKPNSTFNQAIFDETEKLHLVLRRNALSPRPYGCGSFVVFLKLEQDVAAFDEKVDKLAEHLGKADYKGYGAAYLMGRHKNGTPLHPKFNSPFEQKNLNDFDFKNDDPDGTVCPFHAHTRKANPRDGSEKRIVRRGKIYGHKDTTEKGVLFLSYQSSLLNFEHIVNNGLYAFNHQSKNTGQDALFVKYSEFQSGHKYQNASGLPVSPYIGANRELVKFKGGLYFYASSISFVKYNLENCM